MVSITHFISKVSDNNNNNNNNYYYSRLYVISSLKTIKYQLYDTDNVYKLYVNVCIFIFLKNLVALNYR